ncbi:glucose 1-dehydrogenase [bacterium]|nr:glucose 1-dehydrogenase [bacterium]
MDKVAFVTGASRGIGRAIALELASSVGVLIINGRDEAALAETAEAVKAAHPHCEVELSVFDVADHDAVKQALRKVQKAYKRLDVLVNNAGIMPERPALMTTPELLEETFAVNTYAPYYASVYASKIMMKAKSGSIINISSIIADQGAPSMSAYSAAKSALLGMTKSLAKEFAPLNIKVNAVAPGFIETDLTAHYDDEQRASYEKKTALGRLGKADDVAKVVGFLASDGAGYVTGQLIHVDGYIKL